ncbi:hypothetical protein BDY24DRAFT_418657 [Mrakia frigida]|uniref:uncharacterized protein n=1 Tax=Mrakia frigida TaxID=29902 RepID=UPI003FCBF63A
MSHFSTQETTPLPLKDPPPNGILSPKSSDSHPELLSGRTKTASSDLRGIDSSLTSPHQSSGSQLQGSSGLEQAAQPSASSTSEGEVTAEARSLASSQRQLGGLTASPSVEGPSPSSIPPSSTTTSTPTSRIISNGTGRPLSTQRYLQQPTLQAAAPFGRAVPPPHLLPSPSFLPSRPSYASAARSRTYNPITYNLQPQSRFTTPPPTFPSHTSSILSISRPNCLLIKVPKSIPTIQIALALDSQAPELASFTTILKDGDRTILQVKKEAPEEEVNKLVKGGLKIDNLAVTVSKLINSSNPNVVECKLVDYVDAEEGAEGRMRQELERMGEVLEFRPLFYGTTRVASGEVAVMMDFSREKSMPGTQAFKQEFDGWKNDKLRFYSAGKATFCNYCRSTEHERGVCTSAPPCPNCHETSHNLPFCKAIIAPTYDARANNPTTLLPTTPTSQPSASFPPLPPSSSSRADFTTPKRARLTPPSTTSPTPSSPSPNNEDDPMTQLINTQRGQLPPQTNRYSALEVEGSSDEDDDDEEDFVDTQVGYSFEHDVTMSEVEKEKRRKGLQDSIHAPGNASSISSLPLLKHTSHPPSPSPSTSSSSTTITTYTTTPSTSNGPVIDKRPIEGEVAML